MHLSYLNAPVTMTAGNCSRAVVVQAQDSSGHPVVQSRPLNVSLAYNGNVIHTSHPTKGYSDANCSIALPVAGSVRVPNYITLGEATIPAGQSSVTVYMIAKASVPMQVIAADQSSPVVYASALQIEPVLPGAPQQLMISGQDTAGVGTCSAPLILHAIDQYANPANVAVPTSVQITGLGSASIFSDPACSQPIPNDTITLRPSNVISGGYGGPNSDVNFYVNDRIAETLSIQAVGSLPLAYGVDMLVTPLLNGSGNPIPPQVHVAIPARPASGTVVVQSGGNLQGALDNAQPGEVIVLQAGGTYAPVMLPSIPNPNGRYISIVSSNLPQLPPQGTRVSPSDAVNMPKIVVSAGNYAIGTLAGPNPPSYFRIIGVEVTMASTVRQQSTLVDLTGVTVANHALSNSQQPNHILLESSYVHGNASTPLQRCVSMGGVSEAVVDSYISDCHAIGVDTQAIASNGPGPYRIQNSYLEGAGENVIFGGAPTDYPNEISSDIEILHNTFAKQPSWNPNDKANFKCLVTATNACAHWTVKNLLEFKNARRVTVDGNTFMYNWADAQTGYSWLTTPRGNGWDYFSVTEDISFTNNVMGHVAQGMNLLNVDNHYPSQSQFTNRVKLQNNEIYDLGDPIYGVGNSTGMLLSAFDNIIFDHNTLGFSNGGTFLQVAGSSGNTNLQITNSIASCGAYGFHMAGGTAKLLPTFYTSVNMSENAFIGCTGFELGNYANANYLPSSVSSVMFSSFAPDSPTNDSDVLSLHSSSPYSHLLPTSDPIGQDLGVNWNTLQRHVQ